MKTRFKAAISLKATVSQKAGLTENRKTAGLDHSEFVFLAFTSNVYEPAERLANDTEVNFTGKLQEVSAVFKTL